MSSARQRQDTLRVPPVVNGAAGAVAGILRDEETGLDEVSRARMERQLLQAWRTHGSACVPLVESEPVKRQGGRMRSVWAASLAASAICGATFGLYALQGRGSGVTEPGVARFELRIGDSAVQSGGVREGQVLESGRHGHIDLDLGSARVDMARESRVRFDRIAAEELSLTLDSGQVDVDFHPSHKGEQRMTVKSRSARVEVVGTRFSVQVDAVGTTVVAVVEGTVNVIPRFGGETRRVTKGERTEVRLDESVAFERAVRSAIEENLRDDAGVEGLLVDAGAPPRVLAANDQTADAVVRRQGATPPAGKAGRKALGPAAIARRLDAARQLLRQGRHALARARLQELASGIAETHERAEALTLIAESYTAQGMIPSATGAYREVVQLAAEHPAGHNAQFALARLLERYTDNREVAADAYRRYLELAPTGALSVQANEALCRLEGDAGCGDRD